jgi:hypothetical protein
MRQRISWESLPSAFQDAILVAFKLQIRYLWIDSLCILQDNKEDWEQEASKMADYYQNAHVTIAANFISDPTRSFLALKDARWIPKRFEVVSKQLPHSFLHARRVCASLMDPAPGTGLTPLAGRGWAWQENVLSCRVLHYLESEIIWECRTSTCCEDETLAREPYNYCQQMKDLRLSPYLMWQSWVGTFSERSLTFESDRLPAISGAAKLVSTSTGSQYLAGLWRDNIIEDLLWKYISPMNEFLERDRLQSRTGIPSWSWASLSWPVYYPTVMERPTLINFKPAVSVLDAHCSVPGLNPFGEVTAGHLRIKGSLISGNLTRSSISTPYTITLNGDIKVKALQGQPSTVSADFALEECKSDLFAGRSVRRTLYLDSRLSSPAPIHCLYLGEGINDDKAGKPQYLALLLGRSTTVKEAFTRIGLCQLSHNDCLKIASTEIVLLV